MGEEIEVASEGEVIVVASVVEEVEEIAVDEAAAEVSQMHIPEFRSLGPHFHGKLVSTVAVYKSRLFY